LKVVSLFSGIGGIELGLHQSGHTTEIFCEVDPLAKAVLSKNFPGVKIEDDINEIRELPSCDLVAAGFPCQDLSQAGGKEGIDGSRSGLVKKLFELIEKKEHANRPPWILIENVPYMLRLNRGKAMSYLTSVLSELGYTWAYRTVDARCFGLPQRRHRVILLASLFEDPKDVIFSQDHSEPDLDGKPSVVDHSNYYGFYWTEGLRGVGWAREAVPPIKCGSSVGIASPPAVWSPYEDIVGTINIRDAERLQGFPEDWTNITTETGKDIKEGARWRLVGNAVSVRVSKWIGENLSQPKGSISDFEGELVTKTWPSAAWGYGDKKYKVPVSKWVANTEQIAISEFLNHPLKPLSARALNGFLGRAARCTNVNYSDEFINSLERCKDRQLQKV
ncbi:DNA cytosine methyltransferase, partial [Bacillus subtilis]